MHIGISDKSNVILRDFDIKSYQKSQLKYWGFIKKGNTYKLKADDSKNSLYRLVNYLFDENIKYTLSNKCQELVDLVISQNKNIESIKRAAKEYKDGTFKEIDILKYKSFLKEIAVRPLKTHQTKAAIHLYIARNGANFSVPGSGKTSVVLSVYEKFRKDAEVNTLFVVGPPSCFQPWRDEFKKTLGRSPKHQILAGGNPYNRKSTYYKGSKQKPELFLTTFQTLLMDHKDVVSFMLRNGVEIFLVIDEAHYIKRVEGNWAKVVLDIAKYAKYRCVLTGTPLPRSYTDIFNLFDFLWPDNEPISATNKIRIKQLEDQGENNDIKKILKRDIGPLFYRVRKSDLGLKPAIFHKPFLIKMNPNEKRIYDAIENRIIEYSNEDNLSNIRLVKKLRRGRVMRLRQCTSYARLLLTAIEDYKEDLVQGDSELIELIMKYDDIEKPAKLEYLLSFAKKMQVKKQKLVIWSNFIKTLELITSTLQKNNINCKLIYGNTPVEQQSVSEVETREGIRQEFLDPSSGLDFLIANPAACAESISLHTTCHSALYYDLSYNLAQYLQSLDRIHRVGGSEIIGAHYYFLQYENTIDQDIANNLNVKAEKMNGLIEEDYSVYNLNMVEKNEDEKAYFRIIEPKNRK